MWEKNWRDEAWSRLDGPWDVIVVGGGITGAGILREAVRLGLRTLLLEQRDFGWGTSSRSSKLIHGGLRYLKDGRLGLTLASVQERDRLLEEGPGLIDPLGFLLAVYRGDRPGRWTYGTGLFIYDLLALRGNHTHYARRDFQMLAPHLTPEGLQGGFQYSDAQTDDARLVLRLIGEAVAGGGLALNYAAVQELVLVNGQVAGVRVRDCAPTGQPDTLELYARVVVNATGVWADRLRDQLDVPSLTRPLRGSHLIFPGWRLPTAQAISFLHPLDRRPVFIFPWENVTLVGTTDLDHDQPLDAEPTISPEEVAYLMTAIQIYFPSLELTLKDVIATFAGVRPIVSTGQADPSREPRHHQIWEEQGLLTVTGGKLTTFRLIALDVLEAVCHRLAYVRGPDRTQPVLNPLDGQGLADDWRKALNEPTRRRLRGRYGADLPRLLATARAGELAPVPGTSYLWAELRWAARAEGVVHLDDLMLRRVRLGLLLPQAGERALLAIRAICQPELGWDDARWEAEEAAYLATWREHYSLPRQAIPLAEPACLIATRRRVLATRLRRQRIRWLAVTMGTLSLALVALFLRRRPQPRRTSLPIPQAGS